jgi:hypothetical protein
LWGEFTEFESWSDIYHGEFTSNAGQEWTGEYWKGHNVKLQGITFDNKNSSNTLEGKLKWDPADAEIDFTLLFDNNLRFCGDMGGPKAGYITTDQENKNFLIMARECDDCLNKDDPWNAKTGDPKWDFSKFGGRKIMIELPMIKLPKILLVKAKKTDGENPRFCIFLYFNSTISRAR